jgi:hypothetical protein
LRRLSTFFWNDFIGDNGQPEFLEPLSEGRSDNEQEAMLPAMKPAAWAKTEMDSWGMPIRVPTKPTNVPNSAPPSADTLRLRQSSSHQILKTRLGNGQFGHGRARLCNIRYCVGER